MRLDRTLGGVLAASVLALCGCSDDGGPTVLPTATTPAPTSTTTTSSIPSTTTATTTAEPTPTTTLQLPDEHVPEVDAFVQEFFAAYNAAQDSRDLSGFEAMYLPQCVGCTEMRDELVGWLADGQTVTGADWVILQQSSAALLDDVDASVIAFRTSGSVIDEAGELLSDIDAADPQIFNIIVRSAELRLVDLAFGPA